MAETIATLVARLEGDSTGFQATMKGAEKDLNSFGASARRAANMANGAFAGITSSAKGMAGTLLTLGAGISIGSLVRDSARFEQQLNVIRAQSRSTAGDMVHLESTIRRVGIEFGIGANAAATAAGELQKAGIGVDAINGGALKSSIALARVLGDDYASAATIAATALSVFRLEAEDLPRVTQGIAATVLAGKFEMSDYALALQQGASAAQLAGLSLDDFNTLLLLFQRRVGGSGSDMGTLSRTLAQRFVPASKEARERMEELGLEFFDARGKFIGLEAAAEELRSTFSQMDQESRQRDFNNLFGTDALRGAAALMDEGSEGVAAFRRELAEQAKISDVTSAKTKGLLGAVDKLTAEWQELGIVVQQSAVGDFFASIVGGATDAVQMVQHLSRAISGLPMAPINAEANTDDLKKQIQEREVFLDRWKQTLRDWDKFRNQRTGELPVMLQGNYATAHERVATLENELNALRTQLRSTLNNRILSGLNPPARQWSITLGEGAETPGATSRPYVSDEAKRKREDAERDYQRMLTESQGAFGRYYDDVKRLLELRTEMPEFSDQIAQILGRSAGDFAKSEAAARGFSDEFAAIAKDTPQALAPLAIAFSADMLRIETGTAAAGTEFAAFRNALKLLMDDLSDASKRKEMFSRFEDLQRSLETPGERAYRDYVDGLFEASDLELSGLFPGEEVGEMIKRLRKRYLDDLASAEGVEGATVRFADAVHDGIRDAFVSRDWDWSSMRESLWESFRGALWDAFIGDQLDVAMREIALMLKRSIGGSLSGLGNGALGKIFGGIAGAGTGDSRNGGEGWGWVGDAVKGIQAIFGGFFADGGYLGPGQWGIAGENGPEPIFGGKTGLTVYPASEGNGSGGSLVQNFQIDARGADAGVEQRIRAGVIEATAAGANLALSKMAKFQRARSTI